MLMTSPPTPTEFCAWSNSFYFIHVSAGQNDKKTLKFHCYADDT